MNKEETRATFLSPAQETVDKKIPVTVHGGSLDGGIRGLICRYLLYLAIFLVSHFPLVVNYRIAVIIANLFAFFSPKVGQSIIENLRGIFPNGKSDEELNRIAKQNLRDTWGRRRVDILAIPKFDKEFVKTHVEFVDMHKYEQAVAEGNGVLLVTCHLGTPAVFAFACLPALGYSVLVPGKRIFDEPATEKFLKVWRYHGGKIIDSDYAYPELKSELKSGGTVAILADHPTAPRGIRVTYFGRDTLMPAGAPALAYRTRAAVLPFYFIKTGKKDFKIVFGDRVAVPPTPEKIEERHLCEIANQYIPFFEEAIRQYPAQWETYSPAWPESFSEDDLHKFWKDFRLVTERKET